MNEFLYGNNPFECNPTACLEMSRRAVFFMSLANRGGHLIRTRGLGFDMKRFEDGDFYKIEDDTISFKLDDDEIEFLLELHEAGLVRPRHRAYFQQALNLMMGRDEDAINDRLRVLVNQLEGVESEEHPDVPNPTKLTERSRQIYEVIWAYPDGLTDDETQRRLEVKLNLPEETLKNSIRYPRGLLEKAGVIERSGERRPTKRGSTAGVWIVTDRTITVDDLPGEV